MTLILQFDLGLVPVLGIATRVEAQRPEGVVVVGLLLLPLLLCSVHPGLVVGMAEPVALGLLGVLH